MRKNVSRLALSVMLLAVSFPAQAQPVRKIVRLGYLGNNQASPDLSPGEKDFVEELHKRGWFEGQNIVIERRYWENRVDRLAAQAAELIRLDVNIIVTNTGMAAQAA